MKVSQFARKKRHPGIRRGPWIQTKTILSVFIP